MIVGGHSILYSADADADRAFFRDVLGLTHADAGGGWLIFGLPPAEIAVHPGKNGVHEFYLMTDDVSAFVADMAHRGVQCSDVRAMSWGALTEVTLPSGAALGVYQPRHARPKPMAVRKKRRRVSAGGKASRGTARRTPPRRPRTSRSPRRRS